MTVKLLKMKTLVMVLLLFIVTLSLGVATYSWYIVSTAPSVRAVETYMKVIDPSMSIARATDEKTPPQEVTNQDARDNMDGSAAAEDKYYDITWGAIVDSFQNDNLELDYPATYDDTDSTIKTATIADDGRLGQLVPLTGGKLGYDLDGEYGKYGVRYYTDPEGKRVCAIGLAIWVRINQENHDLVMSVANTTVKNAAGEEVVSNDNVKVSARVLTSGYQGKDYIPATFNQSTGTHVARIYDASGEDGTGAMPVNTPVLVEIVVYMEGNSSDQASSSQTGILAKHINQQLFVNIERVTFYDNKAIAN